MINPYLKEEREYPLTTVKRLAMQLQAEGHDIIDLTIGDPQDETFDGARLAIQDFMTDNCVSQYPLATGSLDYLQAVAGWVEKHYQLKLEPIKHIFSSNGSKEAIFLFALTFDWSIANKEIWFSSISYPVYEASARTVNAPIRKLPVDHSSGFFPDLDAIPKQQWEKCRLFWLNSPHNPTSMTIDRNYYQHLLSLADKYGFIVCSDECYNELYQDNRPVCSLDFSQSDRWVAFRSLSKRSHMTGFRIGAVLSRNEEIMKYFRLCRSPVGVGMPTYNQLAGIAAWKDETHVDRNRLEYRQKRKLISSALTKKGFEIHGGQNGFYFWLSHPDYPTATELCNLFLQQGICVTPGTAFGSDGEGYVRLVYCISMDLCLKLNDRLNQLLP